MIFFNWYYHVLPDFSVAILLSFCSLCPLVSVADDLYVLGLKDLV